MCNLAEDGLPDGDAVLIDPYTPPWYKNAAVLVRFACPAEAPVRTSGQSASAKMAWPDGAHQERIWDSETMAPNDNWAGRETLLRLRPMQPLLSRPNTPVSTAGSRLPGDDRARPRGFRRVL